MLKALKTKRLLILILIVFMAVSLMLIYHFQKTLDFIRIQENKIDVPLTDPRPH